MSSESRQQERHSPYGAEGGDPSPLVLVDGSNVAHSSAGEQALLGNIVVVCDKLREEGYEPLVMVDAALRHQIDDRPAYERMVEHGAIRQAPAGTDADYFLLSFARELDASIVSNDRFKDRQKAFPDAAKRLIRYMIVKGEVVLERRTERRDD
jgi:Zc3h12a-like ribonuclease protein